MKVIVSLEYRFDCLPDGSVWTQTTFNYPFWQQYLEVFDHVDILARARIVDSVHSDFIRVDGKYVFLTPLPYYVGPTQYLVNLPKIKRVMKTLNKTSAFILRIPSQVGNSVEPMLRRAKRPYGVQVVGDPYDVFAPGSIKHPFRSLFRYMFARQLRAQCFRAGASAYVTEKALQARYPPALNMFTTHFSDVVLHDQTYVAMPRFLDKLKTQFTVILVGTLAQLYKAPDILIDALAVCVNDYSLDINLVFVGDGQFRSLLEHQVQHLGLSKRVRFLGQIASGNPIYEQFDLADIFVLPSRQEGLPRAMIEAMARGLPCIGSTVGGIPELLLPEDMVPPGDAQSLAEKIREIISDPDRMMLMSARNLEKARQYHESILSQQRLLFLQAVRARTQQWFETRSE